LISDTLFLKDNDRSRFYEGVEGEEGRVEGHLKPSIDKENLSLPRKYNLANK